MKIKELLERYDLKTRQALYDRLKALDIELDKDERGHNYANDEQIDILDQLNEHLKAGGIMSNFTPVSEAVVENSLEDTADLIPYQNKIEQVIDRLLDRLTPQDPLSHHTHLERASAMSWELSTSEVRELIGVKPRGVEYMRGCWVFERIKTPQGYKRIGNEASWRVYKVQ
jgi:molybdopterin converting factor small subunit